MFFGPEGRIAAEENAFARTHHRRLVDDRAIPLIELDADVALDPRECIVLADCQDDVVAGNRPFTDHRAAIDAAILIDVVFHKLERHADELAVLEHEFLR